MNCNLSVSNIKWSELKKLDFQSWRWRSWSVNLRFININNIYNASYVQIFFPLQDTQILKTKDKER